MEIGGLWRYTTRKTLVSGILSPFVYSELIISSELAKLTAHGYCTLKIPSRRKRVTIFVDPETEAIPTTEIATDGLYNVVLAKLYLDELGRYHRFLRFLGLLTTLYVLHPASWAESSSRTSTGSPDGRE